MCFFFRRHQTSQPQCNHKWKPLPWHLTIGRFDSGRYSSKYDWIYWVKVTKSYICVKCKKCNEEKLFYRECDSEEERDERVKELFEKYGEKIKPYIEIQEMIRDMQLVDEEYLRLIDEFSNPSDDFAGVDLFAEIKKIKEAVAGSQITNGG